MVSSQINIKRGKEITPISYIDRGQIAEIKKHGNRFHEFYMLEAIYNTGLHGKLFIDVGAHVGNHSIFFAKYCNANVISYEADRQTYEVLLRNINSNHLSDKITAINEAVGDENIKCSIEHNENRPGQSKVIKSPGNLTMTTLSHIEKTVALIKVDVEGNEAETVLGCMDVINRDKPELFIETFGDHNKILKLLPEGYKMIKRYNNAPTYHFSISFLNKIVCLE